MWHDSYPIRKCRLATHKNYWELRYYHPSSRHKNYFSYPSVHRLLREQGIELDTANIPATGPNGRLLKGDILAYLGRVKQDYLHEQSQRLNNLSHLNLSRSKSVSVDAAPQSSGDQTKSTNDSSDNGDFEHSDVEMITPISLDAVHHCQELLRRSLDVGVPLSRFISQASKIANKENPLKFLTQSKEDAIFDAIVEQGKSRQKPNFVPNISSPQVIMRTELKERKVDYLYFLTAKWPTTRATIRSERRTPKSVEREAKILSVRVKKEDRGAASTYLKKLKALLEVEPCQLII